MSDQATFSIKLRVYYENTDAGGVVYHSNYLNFMERCRCDWLDQLGYDVVSMQENEGVIWVVREANVKFNAPAKLFDELVVSCTALQVGKVKLLVEQNIYNEGVLLCTGVIKLATLDKTSFKLTAMPHKLRAALG